MDIPVSGRLNDPQFRVGKIILQVLVNVMTKAATSPFKLLGAIVGGGEELSFVEFVPGTVTVNFVRKVTGVDIGDFLLATDGVAAAWRALIVHTAPSPSQCAVSTVAPVAGSRA